MGDIGRPPWMDQGDRTIRRLDEILPHIEDPRLHHEDGEEDVRPLAEVLKDTVWEQAPPEPALDAVEREGGEEQIRSEKNELPPLEAEPAEQGASEPQAGEQPSEPEPVPQPPSQPSEVEAVEMRPEVFLSPDMEGIIRQEAERIFEEERQRAWESVERELTEVRARLLESIRRLEEAAQELTGAFDDNFLALLEHLVRTVTRQELSISRDGLRRIVEESVEAAGMNGEVVVRLSRPDYEYLMDADPSWLQSLGSKGAVRVEPDDALEPGDCVVETPTGRVDNTVARRLEKVVEAIYDAADSEE